MKIFITICLIFLAVNGGLVNNQRDLASCMKDAEDAVAQVQALVQMVQSKQVDVSKVVQDLEALVADVQRMSTDCRSSVLKSLQDDSACKTDFLKAVSDVQDIISTVTPNLQQMESDVESIWAEAFTMLNDCRVQNLTEDNTCEQDFKKILVLVQDFLNQITPNLQTIEADILDFWAEVFEMANDCRVQKLALASPHYEDPVPNGCRSDEEAVQIQGIAGDFCSPQCSSGNRCPTDMPAGDTATPTCALQTTSGAKYCALICDPSSNENQCGTGTCKSVQGTGLCTYNDTGDNRIKTQTELVLESPHYEDPVPNGCRSDEEAVQITGVAGDFCSPQCTGLFKTKCPTDMPAGDTATPTCALQTTSGAKYCALICDPSSNENQCGTGTCKSVQGTGLCTYNDTGDKTMIRQQAELVLTSTHYEDPVPNGCRSDEEAVQITGVAGDFCSPQCTGLFKTRCPTDMPAGDTATPTCALQTTSGAKYCALICNPSSNENQCGTGTCKSVQGTGLCTYNDTGDKTLIKQQTELNIVNISQF